jgi:sugar phosphate isomerase/epimerase
MAEIPRRAGSRNTGAVWDPANCLIEPGETPAAGAVMLGSAVSHVHIKDLRRTKDGWEHVLTGEGNTRAVEIIRGNAIRPHLRAGWI